MGMKTETIRAIFTNILFVVGVVLSIIGFIQGALTVTRTVVFDKYPLQSFEESRCYYENRPELAQSKTPDSTQKEKECLQQLDYERNVRQTEDIVRSLSFMASGFVLIYFFRRFIYN